MSAFVFNLYPINYIKYFFRYLEAGDYAYFVIFDPWLFSKVQF